MSVITTSDGKIEKAKELMSEAYKELLLVFLDETNNNSAYKDEYIDEIHEVALQLLKLKRKL
jgi:hypothetical protein